MKVASNSVGDMARFYHEELDPIYGNDEVNAILNAVFEHYAGFERNKFQFKAGEHINQSDLLKLYDCCKELKGGKPLQYILHEAWFFGLKFYVNGHVLIPRPETEELVDLVIRENPSCASLLDIGTGSGCIPVSIKTNIPGCMVSACDISAKALAVAMKNAALHKAIVNFFEADVLQTDEFIKKAGQKYDVLVSNPPYVKLSEKDSLLKNVTDHEPHTALFVPGGDDIVFYRKIIKACAGLLNEKGKLYFELNPITSDEVKGFAIGKKLFQSVEILRDMSGKSRFLKAVLK